MVKRNSGSANSRRALDLWQAPSNAGEPLVCLATTFTFDATFFETECLGRFLQMDTHPSEGESVGYIIEREEKLAAARVAVLVDRRHATDKESLRWDVLPVIVPRGIQHAKLSLLCWANFVRVIVASANLTEPAYRKNVEVCGALEASRSEGGAVRAIRECLDFLGEVIDRASGREDRRGPRVRGREALAAVRTRIRGWSDNVSDRQAPVPVFGSRRRPVLEQLQAHWLPAGPPRAACVVAPFYEVTPSDRAVGKALVDVLAKRGPREIYFDVRCEDHPDGRVRVYASKGMVDQARGSCDVEVRRVKAEQGGETRPLHAKGIWLENESDRLLMVGSSNFTVAGLGLEPSRANLEANLVYRSRAGDEAYSAVEDAWPDLEDECLDVDDLGLVWEPVGSEDGESDGPAPLPAAFQEAIYLPGERPSITLSLGDALPPRWTIAVPGGPTLLSSTTSGPGEHVLPWEEKTPPFVLDVAWSAADGASHAASWPVNVEDPACLPPPDALRNLTLEELVEVLGSTRPLSQAVVAVLKKRRQRASVEGPIIDPLERFNNEAHLLRRSRRVALALDRLRERLERPVLTKEALDWRLQGPIGPAALARAFAREATLPGEAVFLLAELALSLSRVNAACAAEGGLDKTVIEKALEESILRLRADVSALEAPGTPVDLKAYVEAAFSETLR